ncbi:MAG: gamma-butyrobetaine,2-oxoglutarate dioxygenase [Rhodobacteraceae bacterium]|jgi:gamma-butyrobetaine dioxygenase|uniref:trimethyllysine dioxygenase n=1 Tax=Salipiger profundus TaxID=1229727 RepID=A0A1U7D956_9RHOB|nr:MULTISPECIES: TauD/TfdA family dioxygenase [Salipiger]APX24663.1 gamma-butyrobetaine dioxygenase [Salipiger profundus]MAB06449.1 gamma-butyrobetaine,2-oxoglutarate dioxygenase [Paracoccaceae bacterium]GFZ96900.1 gamma-butyrobetaine hydroxylase [Salipiger profundus]SFB79811.1 gamma-butyrobetaine dioxygenase [Salipiger profundus]
MNVMTSPVANPLLKDKGLEIVLSDGQPHYFNYYWLRDNCPSSFSSATRERGFDIFHLDAAPVAASAEVAGDALELTWTGEDHVTRFPLAWLETYAAPGPRHDPADLPREAWYGDHYPQVPRFSQPELVADPAVRAKWIEALLVEGFAIVTDMPDSDAGLTETAELIGQVRPTFFGDYFDVKTHINPTNTAYTASALELHTDTPAEEHAPGVQFLHCRANTVDGGYSLYADGVAVANAFRERDPEGFRLLSEIAVPFFCEHDTYDMRSRQTVIELDQHGEVSGLTISQHMLDLLDLDQALLDDWYPAFCRFGKMLQEEKYMMTFLMKAGECMVFDNHRIVHGRAAYTAESGDRYLRGCYTDRAEMRSTYRALVSEGRFKA